MSKQNPLPCLILDADVIIFTHRSNLWKFLCDNCVLATGGIVANEESIYYQALSGKHIPIDVSGIKAACHVIELDAPKIGIIFRELDKILEPDEVRALDDGEAEIISLYYHGVTNKELFCTGDRAAIKIMTILGFSDNCISLEKVLESIQHGYNITLPWEYTDNFLQHYIAKGKKLIK